MPDSLGRYEPVVLSSPDRNQDIIGNVRVRATRTGEQVELALRAGARLGLVFEAFDRTSGDSKKSMTSSGSFRSKEGAIMSELQALTGRRMSTLLAGIGGSGPSVLLGGFQQRLDSLRDAMRVTRVAVDSAGRQVAAPGDYLVRIGGVSVDDLCRSAASDEQDHILALRRLMQRAIKDGARPASSISWLGHGGSPAKNSSSPVPASGRDPKVVVFRIDRFSGPDLELPPAAWDAAGTQKGAAKDDLPRRVVPRLILDRIRSGDVHDRGYARRNRRKKGSDGTTRRKFAFGSPAGKPASSPRASLPDAEDANGTIS